MNHTEDPSPTSYLTCIISYLEMMADGEVSAKFQHPDRFIVEGEAEACLRLDNLFKLVPNAGLTVLNGRQVFELKNGHVSGQSVPNFDFEIIDMEEHDLELDHVLYEHVDQAMGLEQRFIYNVTTGPDGFDYLIFGDRTSGNRFELLLGEFELVTMKKVDNHENIFDFFDENGKSHRIEVKR